MAKPGTELQRFLARQNGTKVRITLTLATAGALEARALERSPPSGGSAKRSERLDHLPDDVVRASRRRPSGRPTTRPVGGSQSSAHHFGRRRPSTARRPGRCRISVRRQQARRIGDVVRPHARRRRSARGCTCCCCCSRRPRSSGRAARSSSSAIDGVLPLLRRAADRVERAEVRRERRPRRSGRASPRRTSRRSPATRSSASSSGWRSRRARDRVSGSKPGETASAKRARNAVAIAAVADVVADDRRPRRDRARRGSGRCGYFSACDAVARVSSCLTLPWMIAVKPSCA